MHVDLYDRWRAWHLFTLYVRAFIVNVFKLSVIHHLVFVVRFNNIFPSLFCMSSSKSSITRYTISVFDSENPHSFCIYLLKYLFSGCYNTEDTSKN